jgi:hypothetical protein
MSFGLVISLTNVNILADASLAFISVLTDISNGII